MAFLVLRWVDFQNSYDRFCLSKKIVIFNTLFMGEE